MFLPIVTTIAAFAFSIAASVYPNKRKILWFLGFLALVLSCFTIWYQDSSRPPTIHEFNKSMSEIRESLTEGFLNIKNPPELSELKQLSVDTKIPINKLIEKLKNGSLFDKGLAAFYSGNVEETKNLLETYINDTENSLSITKALLGNTLYSLQDYSGAIRNYEEAYNSNLIKRNPNVINNWGSALNKIGKHDLANEKYKEAIELDSDFYLAWYNWGNSLRDLGKFLDAVDKYKIALRLRPDLPEAWNNLGTTLKQLGKTDQALEKYSEALKHNPSNDAYMVNIGNTYYELIDYENAIIFYSKAHIANPSNVNALLGWGASLCALNKCVEAIEKYELAVKVKPDNATAYYNWGNALVRENQYAESIDKYKAATQIDPTYISAYRNWGKALIRLGRENEGMLLIQKAESLSKNN